MSIVVIADDWPQVVLPGLGTALYNAEDEYGHGGGRAMTDEPAADKSEEPQLLAMPTWEVDGLEHLEADVLPEAPPAEVPPPAPSPSVQEVKDETPPPLVRIIEAMLFVGGAPLTAARACEAIRGLTPEDFQQTVDTLNRSYRAGPTLPTPDTGARLRPGAAAATLPGCARNCTEESARPGCRRSPWTCWRWWPTGSRPRAQEIDSLRGADSGGVLRQLVRHGLIALRRGEGEEKEDRYVTTQRFLDLFHLHGLEDLPQTRTCNACEESRWNTSPTG